jgi:RHS repeat-associated protein
MQNYDSGTEITYYIGGLMEEVETNITDYRHYVYAGSEPVAILSRKSTGVNTWSYLLSDHIGSVAAITSSTGTVDINESFSSFGARRNPTTWSGAPASGDLTTIAGLSREGFTFQTALGQSMGLNHMNGRVQDAITGRFLSADPNIPDPTSAQSYNRFSYVSNNPLSYIDPSGFDENDASCLSGCWTTVYQAPPAGNGNLYLVPACNCVSVNNSDSTDQDPQFSGAPQSQPLTEVFQGSYLNSDGSVAWQNLQGGFYVQDGVTYWSSAFDDAGLQPLSGLMIQQAALGDLQFTALATVVVGSGYIAAPYLAAGASTLGVQASNFAKVTTASFGLLTNPVSTQVSLVLGDSQAMATILGDAPEALSALDKAMSTSEALTEEIESAAGGDAGGVATEAAEKELEILEELAKSRPKPMK